MEGVIPENGIKFELPKYQSSYIKVIGVGGGGTNAVNHMYSQGIEGVDFIICNTDDKSLDSSPVPTKIKLGKSGLGAGNIPAVAREKAEEVSDEIKEVLLHNTQMLFITAGMGGGTGTGAAPVVARLAKEIDLDDPDVPKILVVAIVTLPFSFEGRQRRLQAEEGIEELRKHVDAILIINNDKLLKLEKVMFRQAFSKADGILLTAAKGIAEIITVKSYINIDFRDVNTVMKSSGVALMGSGIAEGDGRAVNAVKDAIASPLLNDSSIKGAKNILLYILCKEDTFAMDEMGNVTDYIQQEVASDANIIWGIGFDESMGEMLNITLIATGFDLTTKEDIHVGGGGIEQGNEDANTPANPNVIPLGPIEDSSLPSFNSKNENEPSSTIEENTLSELEDKLIHDELTDNSKSPSTIPEFIINNTHEIPSGYNLPHKVEEKPQEIIEGEPYIKPSYSSNLSKENPVLIQQNLEDSVLERERRLKIIKEKLQNPRGMQEFEDKPAYKILEMSLEEPEDASKSEISGLTISENSGFTDRGNSFIYDQPD